MTTVVPFPRRPDPEPLWREAVGAQLRTERRRRGERIADVATRAGVSPQYLSEIERGRKDPSSEVLAALAGALGLRVLDLTQRSATRLCVLHVGVGRPTGPVALAA
ncbi:helix-turn-helix domain-containing protein [Microlunatus flavus]|uniref:Helix-turn-helix domain-containing protein n=1 Tax=Microlunatus flavus TaxID=1036181 RepID=A0A1H9HI13_9ACTN|nr:helix-turn-helix transcriptional regulator [Microlunatus flavus]SEQ61947.1 Helix-turn-helix domain-containing protein [Microlunatus flavus]